MGWKPGRRVLIGVVIGAIGLMACNPASAIPSIGPSKPVVLLATTGLRWSDVSETDTPAISELAETWALGNTAVRSIRPVTCPADGWLTVSAGTRTADLPAEHCRELTEPVDGVVPNWAEYQEAAATNEYSAQPGLLGDTLLETGTIVRAIGPGAAIATARSDGTVPNWEPRASTPEMLGSQITQALDGGASLVVVDLGSVQQQSDITRIDRELGEAIAASGDATVLVMSLADRADAPELQLAAANATALRPALLSSASTRQQGLVLGTDITATLLSGLGLTSDVVGSPIFRGPVQPADPVAMLADMGQHASVARPLVRWFYLGLVVANIVLYTGVWFGLARGSKPRTGEQFRQRVLRLVQVIALTIGAIPIGLLVANQVPWWRAANPSAALIITGAVVTAVVVTTAMVGPWRRSVLGPAGIVAAITAIVIVADVLTGARLQISAVLGVPTLAAGRFYGFNNTAFALGATATLFAAAALVDQWVRAEHRGRAAAVTAGIGALLVAIDGAPSLGADFGGPPALIPAFTVMALLVGGARITMRRIVTVLIGAGIVTAAFAILDWLRPPESRTHLGSLVETLLTGGLWSVLDRKISSNLAIIANNRPLTLLALAGTAFIVAVLIKPIRNMVLTPDGGRYGWLSHGTGLSRMSDAAPTLAPGLLAIATVGIIGFTVNDSGISIPALSVALTLPLTIAAAANWLLGLAAPTGDMNGQTASPGESPLGNVVSSSPVLSGLMRRLAGPEDPRRRTAVLLGVIGSLAVAAMLTGTLVTGRSAPGDVTQGKGVPVPAPVVVIGVQGLRWEDVSPGKTPMLWFALQTNAQMGGVAPAVTDPDRRCASSGWLALSAGSPVVADEADGPACLRWHVEPQGTGAVVDGWSALVDAQLASAYSPRLGGLIEGFDGVCVTAVGPGAALALADETGAVDRYFEVEAALDEPAEAFACPATFVDAGSAPYAPPSLAGRVVDLAAARTTANSASRDHALAVLDARIGQLVAAVPDGATIIVTSVGNPSLSRPVLGVGAVISGESEPLYLSSSATRWEGVVRLLDLPSTVLTAVDAEGLSGGPWVGSGTRSDDNKDAVEALITQTVRDQALRGLTGWLTGTLAVATLVLVGGFLAARPLLDRRGIRTRRRVGNGVHIALTIMSAVPIGGFLMTSWQWWRADQPVAAMWGSMVGASLAVAAVSALARSKPIWAAPAVLAGITFAVLTLDALFGTPLHRGSPLGPSPTLGGRYYGFGNPTYSIYVVAALVTAAAIGWAIRHRNRWLGAAVAAMIGFVALLVDVLPMLGADVGGGLVLLPAVAVIVLAVAGVRLTWVRVGAAGLAGVLFVAVIGFMDWLQPVSQRSHLGTFVQSAIDGTAWTIVARKAGYAAESLGSGPMAWFSILVVIAGVFLIWPGGPIRKAWFDQAAEEWPILRPLIGSLLIAAVAGALVNDYGTRIITVLLAASLPLLGLVALRSTEAEGDQE